MKLDWAQPKTQFSIICDISFESTREWNCAIMRDFEKMSVFLGKNPSTLYDAEPILTFSIMQCSHTTRNTYYYLKEKQVKAKEWQII